MHSVRIIFPPAVRGRGGGPEDWRSRAGFLRGTGEVPGGARGLPAVADDSGATDDSAGRDGAHVDSAGGGAGTALPVDVFAVQGGREGEDTCANVFQRFGLM